MFNLLLKIDKTWDFLVEPPNINHWKNFFLIHILEKTLLVFPRWVPNIHLVEFQPNRRFCYDLIPAPCALDVEWTEFSSLTKPCMLKVFHRPTRDLFQRRVHLLASQGTRKQIRIIMTATRTRMLKKNFPLTLSPPVALHFALKRINLFTHHTTLEWCLIYPYYYFVS